MQLQFVYLQRKEKKSSTNPKSFPSSSYRASRDTYKHCEWQVQENIFRGTFSFFFCASVSKPKNFFFLWRTNRDKLNLKKKDEGRRTFHQLLQALPIHNTSRFTQCPSSHFFIISPYCPKTKRNNRNNSKNSHRLMTNDIEFFSG